MNRPPHVSPVVAGTILALIDFAESRAPGQAAAFLRGWCSARSHDQPEPPSTPPPSSDDPRREPSSNPPGMPLARVALTRRLG